MKMTEASALRKFTAEDKQKIADDLAKFMADLADSSRRDDLTPYQGQWVVTEFWKVIRHDEKFWLAMPAKMVDRYRNMPGVSFFYVPRPDEVMTWAVRYPGDDPNRAISPNCMFSSREKAEEWINRWPAGEYPEGATIWTREATPWRQVD